MIPIQAYLAAEHLADLQREATEARRARSTAFSEGDSFGDPMNPRHRLPDVRHLLALAALRVSDLADGTARRLDPCLE